MKGYRQHGDSWRLGKGKPPLDPTVDLYAEYKKLWELYLHENPKLLEELRAQADAHLGILTDMFAGGEISQARALADILNETDV